MDRFARALAIIALAVPLSAAGCDELDEEIDCRMICQRYADCFDSGYDVGSCTDRCEDNADRDEAFADRADRCENCLDDRSCGGTFACTSECVGIVP